MSNENENPSAKARESKQWWAVTEFGDVQLVIGYTCKTKNPDVWWVPELGLSMTEGYTLFPTEKAAIARALFEQHNKKVEAEKRICRLNARKKQP